MLIISTDAYMMSIDITIPFVCDALILRITDEEMILTMTCQYTTLQEFMKDFDFLINKLRNIS